MSVDNTTENNTTSNLVNRSFVTRDNDRIYFTSSTNNHLYSQKLDGSDRKDLSEKDAVEPENLIAKDSYLYTFDFISIQRRKLGGSKSEMSTLTGDDTIPNTFLMLSGDWIYYTVAKTESTEGTTWKMRIDGSDSQKIYDQDLIDFVVDGDWIYFCNYEDNYSLYKIKTDGSEETKLNDEISTRINMDSDYIYYELQKTAGKGDSIYRIRKDGSDKTSLGIPNNTYFGVANGVIYHWDKEQGGSLCRTEVDQLKTEIILPMEKLSEQGVGRSYKSPCINLVGGRIYFKLPYQPKENGDMVEATSILLSCDLNGEDLKAEDLDLLETK